jgi:hypothetical protein
VRSNWRIGAHLRFTYPRSLVVKPHFSASQLVAGLTVPFAGGGLLWLGATPPFVLSIVASIIVAAALGSLVFRADPDLVWISSPVVTTMLMRASGYITGDGHGEPDSGIVIGISISVVVPFLVGWADVADSDFHRFLHNLHPLVKFVLGLAVAGIVVVWLVVSTILASCWGHPYC